MFELDSWVVINFFTGLLLVLLIQFQSGTSRVQSGRKYSSLLVMTLFLLCAETIGKVGEVHAGNYIILAKIGYFLIYLLDPVDILFALQYIDCWMDDKNMKARRIFGIAFQVFAICNILGVFSSQITGTGLFYYFEDGAYYRGPLFMFRAVLLLTFIILLVVYTIVFKQNIMNEYRNFIILLPAVSLFGSLFQIFFAAVDTTYAGITIGCLVLFFYLQSKDVNVDYLTGLLNRRGLDMKLEEMVKHALINDKKFTAIMMDVDHFKEINDHYGHSSGDKTIQDVAMILLEVFGSSAEIGRFGGDEFSIITEEHNEDKIKEMLDKVHVKVAELKNRNGWNVDLDVSCGFLIYMPAEHMTVETFQETIDALMYKEKKQHHLNDRRKGD